MIEQILKPLINDGWKIVSIFSCDGKYMNLIRDNKYPLDYCAVMEYTWWTECGCDMNDLFDLPKLSPINSDKNKNKKRKFQQIDDSNNHTNSNSKFRKTNDGKRISV